MFEIAISLDFYAVQKPTACPVSFSYNCRIQLLNGYFPEAERDKELRETVM
jgi:hypothetical protein